MKILSRSLLPWRTWFLAGRVLPLLWLAGSLLTSPLSQTAWARSNSPGKRPGLGAAGTGQDGVLLSCGKDVFVRAQTAADWHDCEIGQPLSRTDRVRTGKTGLTTVEWGGGRLWLDGSSQLVLDAGKKAHGALQLVEGSARISYDPGAQKGAKPLRVLTPEGELRLRGVARVEIGPDAGEMQVAVYDGQGEIAGKHGVTRIRAGTGAVFRRGAREKVGGLIGAPSWEAVTGLFFAFPQKAAAPGPLADLSLPFRPVQGAVRYRLEIGRDDALTDRVYLGTLAAETKLATAKLALRGRFFVRLQALDSDQVAGPGPVQAVDVAELRGDHLGVEPQSGSARLPLLTGAGELSFEILAGAGRLSVQADGKDLFADKPGAVTVRLGRGPHRLLVATDSGARGELRVEVTRPSYAIDIVQDGASRTGRGYRFEVRALDTSGQSAEGGVKAQSAPVKAGAAGPGQALALLQRGDGVYSGEVDVPAGRTVRLSLSDADGSVASADLHGSSE